MLVGIDGGAAARAALRRALLGAGPADRLVAVAGLLPTPDPLVPPIGRLPWPTTLEQCHAREDTLRDEVARVREEAGAAPAVEVRVRPGPAERVLAEFARELRADVVLIGAPDGDGPRSLAARLARLAPCPVTTVPVSPVLTRVVTDAPPGPARPVRAAVHLPSMRGGS